MARVAVIGAAGYLGMELVRELAGAGHEIVAVTRPNGRMLLQGQHLSFVLPDEVDSIEPADVVVNLAYPNRGTVSEYPKRNREILNQVLTLAGGKGRVIHASTQAVFGYCLEYPIAPRAIPARRDFVYVESKIELEHLLADNLKGRDLRIVRLGNIIGPASQTWILPLIEKLVYGDPVALQGHDGYSNSTDVVNAASYFRHLVESDPQLGTTYYHLAEFGSSRWSFWIDRLSRRLAVDPVTSNAMPYYPGALKDDIRKSLRGIGISDVAKSMLAGRFSGSVLRSFVRAVPQPLRTPLRSLANRGEAAPIPGSSRVDDIFLNVISCEKLFATLVDNKWTPPLDLEESWQMISLWIEEAGFLG